MESPNIFVSGLDRYVLYFLPAETLLNMCQLSRRFAIICNDEMFWSGKLHYDYPEIAKIKPIEMTSKQTYLDLVKDIIKPFPIYFEGNLIAHVWLRNTNTQREALSFIHQFFDTLVPAEKRQHEFFVHVLSRANAQQYVPILLENDDLVTANFPEYNGSLWRNAAGFEIILGHIAISYARSVDEVSTFYLSLPGQQMVRGPYPG